MQQEVFVVDLPIGNSGRMKQFQAFMDEANDAMIKYIQELAKELGVSEACAQDVYYLRSRSRWTKELEQTLIQLHAQGKPPNMCDFGN